jgi:hypothetical protein
LFGRRICKKKRKNTLLHGSFVRDGSIPLFTPQLTQPDFATWISLTLSSPCVAISSRNFLFYDSRVGGKAEPMCMEFPTDPYWIGWDT